MANVNRRSVSVLTSGLAGGPAGISGIGGAVICCVAGGHLPGVRQSRPLIRASVAAAACSAAASAAWLPEPNMPSSISMAWPCAVATMADVRRAAAVSLPLASSADGDRKAAPMACAAAAISGWPSLLSPDAGQGLEQGPLIVGEVHVGAGRGGEPLGGCPGCGVAVKVLGEQACGPQRDCGQQRVPVGEVPVRRGCRDPEAAAGLRHRERLGAALAEQLDGSLDQRLAQVAVVIAAAPGRPSRSLAVPGHRGAGKGTMRRMNASHPRSPRTRRATGARRAWEPTL